MKHRITKSWLPDLPDFRDQLFEVSKPKPLSKKVDLRTGLPPIYDQDVLGSCGPNAIGAVFDFERNRQGKPFLNPSRLFMYFNARETEGSINEDAGIMIRDGIKSVAKKGVCSEIDWPYDIAQFATRPSPACYASALNNQVLSYRRIAPNLRSMMQCLASGFPFVFGFSVFDSFESDAVAKTGIVPMPKSSETLLGGHAVVACGYNQNTTRFLCRNSWGAAWGQDGYFEMPFDYLSNENLADDRWTIKLVE